MTVPITQLAEKIYELEEELKRCELWQKEAPAWVAAFDENDPVIKASFALWLQFIFIPNQLHYIKTLVPVEKKYIGPQAKKYFGDSTAKGKLLQVIIEIDSLR